jgi:hypothetical protein
MEHGRVEYQYRPGLAPADVKQLESLFNEAEGQWAQDSCYCSSRTRPAALRRGRHGLGSRPWLQDVQPGRVRRVRDFRLMYTNQGPEQLGTGPE